MIDPTNNDGIVGSMVINMMMNHTMQLMKKPANRAFNTEFIMI